MGQKLQAVHMLTNVRLWQLLLPLPRVVLPWLSEPRLPLLPSLPKLPLFVGCRGDRNPSDAFHSAHISHLVICVEMNSLGQSIIGGTPAWEWYRGCYYFALNPLTPNDPYSGRTAPLTSKRCILYIYSTNTGTEYFKHGTYSPFFPLQNAVCFVILTYLVPVLFTFYIQGVLNVAFYIFIQQI